MCSTSPERCIDCHSHALRCGRLVFENQDEIHQVPYAAVRRLAWTGVRVKLFRPMLIDGERRHHNGRNAGEAEPIFALDTLKRLQDFVSDAEVDVKLHERSTIETGIDWKPRAAFWSLIQSAIASPTMNVKKSGSSIDAANWSRSRSESGSATRP